MPRRLARGCEALEAAQSLANGSAAAIELLRMACGTVVAGPPTRKSSLVNAIAGSETSYRHRRAGDHVEQIDVPLAIRRISILSPTQRIAETGDRLRRLVLPAPRRSSTRRTFCCGSAIRRRAESSATGHDPRQGEDGASHGTPDRWQLRQRPGRALPSCSSASPPKREALLAGEERCASTVARPNSWGRRRPSPPWRVNDVVDRCRGIAPRSARRSTG